MDDLLFDTAVFTVELNRLSAAFVRANVFCTAEVADGDDLASVCMRGADLLPGGDPVGVAAESACDAWLAARDAVARYGRGVCQCCSRHYDLAQVCADDDAIMDARDWALECEMMSADELRHGGYGGWTL